MGPDGARSAPTFLRTTAPFAEQQTSVSHSDEPRPVIADDDLKKLARDDFAVEFGVSSVEAQERSAGELGRRRHKDDIAGTDAADNGRAQLLVAAAKDESLCADWTEDELAIAVVAEQTEYLSLGEVRSDELVTVDRVDAEERLLYAERAPNRLRGATRAKQEQRARRCGD